MNARCLLIAGALGASSLISASAQIVTDGTMGAAGALTGPNFAIPDTLGQSRGNNLFHSFSQFNVAAGESATFSGPANIQNVLARVTGGTASTIDGALTCDIAGANFFFINPFGVIFGANAQINVSGSLVVTTADYVKLADGGRFNARTPANDLLTTAPISAFGFLGPTVAPVTMEGTVLATQPGSALAVVGGDITLRGVSFSVPAGRFDLVSAASAGELAYDVADLGGALNTATFAGLGELIIEGSSVIDLSGDPNSRLEAHAAVFESRDFSSIFGSNQGAAAGGDFRLVVRETFTLDAGALSLISEADGSGGNLTVEASQLYLLNSASVDTAAVGNGTGGDVTLTASEIVQLDAAGTIRTFSFGPGDSGNLIVTAPVIIFGQDSQVIATGFDSGRPGDITLTADTITFRSAATLNSDTQGTTVGGNIFLNADLIEVLSGSEISASSYADGTAGNITVQAGRLVLDGSGFGSGASLNARAFSTGDAGSILLNVGKLELRNAAAIRASAANSSGGNITITANRTITLADSVITAQARGDGGNLQLTAPLLIYLNGSAIAAASTLGNGGNITIDPIFVVLNNSSLLASAIVGNGGNIDITTQYLLSAASLVNASSQFGLDGSITINAPRLDLTEAIPVLLAEFLDAEAQLQPHCLTRLPANVSTFITTGRGATPYRPDELHPPPTGLQ